MILDSLRRPLKLRHFLVLVFLTPIIFFVGIGILAVLEPSDIPSLKEKPYECGGFGDKKMRIDRRYLFFASVEYQDVNYWEKGFNQLHNTKGCNDQIQSASFTVQWPEMSLSEGFRLDSKKLDNITISLDQRSVWPVESGNKNFFDASPSLIFYLSDMSTQTKISIEQINTQKKI